MENIISNRIIQINKGIRTKEEKISLKMNLNSSGISELRPLLVFLQYGQYCLCPAVLSPQILHLLAIDDNNLKTYLNLSK